MESRFEATWAGAGEPQRVTPLRSSVTDPHVTKLEAFAQKLETMLGSHPGVDHLRFARFQLAEQYAHIRREAPAKLEELTAVFNRWYDAFYERETLHDPVPPKAEAPRAPRRGKPKPTQRELFEENLPPEVRLPAT